MLQLQYLQIFHVWRCISLCSFTFRGVWSVREAGTVSRGNWIKSVKILRSFLVDSCVQGASVPLSPPCIFHHTLPFFFILFSFSLPSKLPCGTCWHGISQPCTQSPLVLSVLELEHVCVCVYAMCLCTHTCETEDLVGDVVLTQSPPSFPFSHAQITLYVIPQSHGKRKIEGERELLRKVYLVSWQHPNYKIVETPCIERIFLNYSERKFKFHFVLALSNGQNCLGEISKGQGELKCLL